MPSGANILRDGYGSHLPAFAASFRRHAVEIMFPDSRLREHSWETNTPSVGFPTSAT